jgi:hypothetical protein
LHFVSEFARYNTGAHLKTPPSLAKRLERELAKRFSLFRSSVSREAPLGLFGPGISALRNDADEKIASAPGSVTDSARSTQ